MDDVEYVYEHEFAYAHSVIAQFKVYVNGEYSHTFIAVKDDDPDDPPPMEIAA